MKSSVLLEKYEILISTIKDIQENADLPPQVMAKVNQIARKADFLVENIDLLRKEV